MAGNGGGGGWIPRQEHYPAIPHYWGDIARELLLGGAALMLFASPFYGDSLREELPFEILGAIVIVGCAALTNPFKRGATVADAVVSGIGLVVFQSWALFGYDSITSVAFVLREAIAMLFLFAFYFSLKTVRAMVLHQVGKPDSIAEFRREVEESSLEEDPLAEEKSMHTQVTGEEWNR